MKLANKQFPGFAWLKQSFVAFLIEILISIVVNSVFKRLFKAIQKQMYLNTYPRPKVTYVWYFSLLIYPTQKVKQRKTKLDS